MSDAATLFEKPTSIRARHKELTRVQILRAARALFERDGVAATSVRDIAELAGVSDTTVFNYFKTKEDLAEALVEQVSGPGSVLARLDGRPASEPPFRALRNVLVDLAAEPIGEDLGTSKRHYALVREDKLLWGAYLRSRRHEAEQLAEAFSRRAPHWSRATASAAAHATVAAAEAVFAVQPEAGSVADWVADVDEVLARLERAWDR